MGRREIDPKEMSEKMKTVEQRLQAAADRFNVMTKALEVASQARGDAEATLALAFKVFNQVLEEVQNGD